MPLPTLPMPPVPNRIKHHVPLLVAKTLSKTPSRIQQLAIKNALQTVFKVAIADGDLEFLENRCIKVDISDANLSWYIGFKNNQFTINDNTQAEALIKGLLNDFLLLACQYEDPDTLFFQRRLVIEGDTELGLHVKNLLDAVDPDTLPTAIQYGIKVAGQFINE